MQRDRYRGPGEPDRRRPERRGREPALDRVRRHRQLSLRAERNAAHRRRAAAQDLHAGRQAHADRRVLRAGDVCHAHRPGDGRRSRLADMCGERRRHFRRLRLAGAPPHRALGAGGDEPVRLLLRSLRVADPRHRRTGRLLRRPAGPLQRHQPAGDHLRRKLLQRLHRRGLSRRRERERDAARLHLRSLSSSAPLREGADSRQRSARCAWSTRRSSPASSTP